MTDRLYSIEANNTTMATFAEHRIACRLDDVIYNDIYIEQIYNYIYNYIKYINVLYYIYST